MVLGVIAKRYMPCVMSETIFFWESITPLPLPVVPDVNTMVASLSGSIS